MAFAKSPTYATPKYSTPSPGGGTSRGSGPSDAVRRQNQRAVNPAATNKPVSAPAGTLRNQLQQNRQGGTAYGSVAQGLQNPEALGLLAAGAAGPLALARTYGTRQVKQKGPSVIRNALSQYVIPNTRANIFGNQALQQSMYKASSNNYGLGRGGTTTGGPQGFSGYTPPASSQEAMLRQLGLIQ